MYWVYLVESHSSRVVSHQCTLEEAKEDAEDWLKKIEEQKLPVKVYIETKEGKRLDPPFEA